MSFHELYIYSSIPAKKLSINQEGVLQNLPSKIIVEAKDFYLNKYTHLYKTLLLYLLSFLPK